MNRGSKKLKSIIMAMMLVIGMMASTIPALAEGLKTKIVITGVEEGCNVYGYAIVLDDVDANGNHYWKYNSNGQVENLLKDGKIDSADALYFYMNLNSQSEGADWNLHDGKGAAVVDEKVLTFTANADGTYSYEGAEPGLYVIAANKETPKYSYNFTIVPVNYTYGSDGQASIADDNGVITVPVKKAGSPTMEKTVVEGKDALNHGDANIGDTVKFEIKIEVPAYAEAEGWRTDNLHYEIKDQLSNGLTLDQDSITIEGTPISDKLGNNKLCSDTEYTTADRTFTLDLFGQDVWQYAGDTVTIAYTATVNSYAGVNFDYEDNTATLRYSNSASSTTLSEPITDTTYHYTFGFDTKVNGTGSETTTELTKYGYKTQTKENVALEGAEFQLFESGKNTPLYFTEAGVLSEKDAAGAVDHIQSSSTGALTVTGLDAGTYTLKESKAPTGYALDKTVYTIVITPSYNENTGKLVSYTVTVNGGTNTGITFTHTLEADNTVVSTDNAQDADTFAIVNTTLVNLPETGGAGVIVVTIAAVIMMAGFGSVFIMLKKKKLSN